MKKRTAQKVVQRRNIIKTLRLRGLSDDDILEVLDSKGLFEGYSSIRHARLDILRKDKVALLQEDRERFSIDGEDSKVAREDYINRLLELFRASYADKQFATARGLAKDIAHQFGVITEEPLQVKHEGTIQHIHSIVDLIKEYHSDNRIVKELEAIVVE